MRRLWLGFNRADNSTAQIRDLSVIMVLLLLGTCLNHAGVNGALYPFLFLESSNFQSWKVIRLALMASGFEFLPLIYFHIVFGLLCLSWFFITVAAFPDRVQTHRICEMSCMALS